MADNLQNFISSVRNIGIARTNRYEAQIFFPGNTSSDNLLRLFCTRVNIPDISVDTAEILIYGEQRVIPYRPRYGIASLSFYMDNDFKIKKTFDDWMSKVTHPTGRTMGYYNNFIGYVLINVLPVSEDQKSYSITLQEAYPKSLENIGLDSSSKGPMVFNLTLNYKYYILGPAKGVAETNDTTSNNDNLAENTGTGIPIATDWGPDKTWATPATSGFSSDNGDSILQIDVGGSNPGDYKFLPY